MTFEELALSGVIDPYKLFLPLFEKYKERFKIDAENTL